MLKLKSIDVGFDLRKTKHIVRVPSGTKSAETDDGMVECDNTPELIRELVARGYRAQIERIHSEIVVTRHPALVEYLRKIGLVDEDVRAIEHATPRDVLGRDVIGVLPLHLAVLANTVTEIPLALTPEDRGKELPLERVREIAGSPRTYSIQAESDEYEDSHTTEDIPLTCAGLFGGDVCGQEGFGYVVSPGVVYVPRCERCLHPPHYELIKEDRNENDR